jgi:hypothetical protein
MILPSRVPHAPSAMPASKPSMTSQYRRIKTCLIVVGVTCYRFAEVQVDQVMRRVRASMKWIENVLAPYLNLE